MPTPPDSSCASSAKAVPAQLPRTHHGFTVWTPLPDTAIHLGRLRAHAHADDLGSDVWYDLHLCAALGEKDNELYAAPALHLSPRLRRAFDLAALREALASWNGRSLPSQLSVLAPRTDPDGFTIAHIAADPERRSDPLVTDSLLP